MDTLNFCFGCLATDVKTFSTCSNQLETSYQLLTGFHNDFLRNTSCKLCWECAALVNKFNTFRLKCERAHNLLQDIYLMHGESFASHVSIIDRNKYKLKSVLTIKAFDSINISDCENSDLKVEYDKYDDFSPHLNFDEFEDRDKTEFEEKTEIKTEAIDYDTQLIDKVTESMKRKKRKRKKIKRLSKHTNGELLKLECDDFNLISDEKFIDVEKKCKNNIKKKYTPNTKIDCSSYATHVMLTQEQQMEEVRQRQFTAEYAEARYKCDLCFKGFNIDKTYNNHMLKHDPLSGPYQCDVCKHRYKQRRHVVNHIFKVHMSKYYCKLCSHVSQSPEQAKNHDKWHTGVTYTCEICGLSFTKRSTHLSHVRIKHPSQHICRACGASFVSERGLAMHSSVMHKEDSGCTTGPYCEPCGIHFSTVTAYHKHVLISDKHEQERDLIPNGCRLCGECFDSEESLKQHARYHRTRRVKMADRVTEFPTKCVQCSEVMENGQKYWQHFRRSHPGLKYPSNRKCVICEFCGRSFSNATLLSNHRRRHTGAKPFPCPVAGCGKHFHSRAMLTAHGTTHADARPHACAVCRKAFKTKTSLVRHEKMHSGEKPFVCELCGRAYSDPSARKLHIKTVHLKEGAAVKCVAGYAVDCTL